MSGDLGKSNTEKHCEFNKNIAKDVGHLHTGKNSRVTESFQFRRNRKHCSQKLFISWTRMLFIFEDWDSQALLKMAEWPSSLALVDPAGTDFHLCNHSEATFLQTNSTTQMTLPYHLQSFSVKSIPFKKSTMMPDVNTGTIRNIKKQGRMTFPKNTVIL